MESKTIKGRMTESERINDILRELELLSQEFDELGPTFIRVVVDSREDDGLPPFTPEELAAAKAECDRNADEANRIEQRMDELQEEFFAITGRYPRWL